MGLDMYLHAKKYLLVWNPEEKALTETIRKALDPESRTLIEENKDGAGAEIIFTIGYWRKANAIHNWFVQNAQGGVDECQESYVSEDNLVELETTVRTVLESKDEAKAEELLPTSQGFFFGTYDYDKWYWEDLKETLTIIQRAKKMMDLGWNITYQSSW